MIKVFGQTDDIFVSNGDVVLKPLKTRVRKEDNGDYYLDLETGLEYVDYLNEGNIVIANTPQGDQPFRINNVTKSKTKISAKCWHGFYDSERYLIADSYVENKNCNDALNHLNSATEPQSPFTVASNVTTINSYRCVRTSLYEAIMTVLERWGGHLVRNGFNIQIRDEIGVDNGVTVEYKKNLKDITCEEDWDDVVTKLLPVGKDGILLNAIDPSASIYVSSSRQYSIPYVKTASFDQQEIVQDDYPDETSYRTALVNDLRSKAEAYVEENSLPKVNYTLKANLEKITDIGDIVEVKDSRLGVDLMTSVIAFEYDCILEKYTEVEFGNFRPSLSGYFGGISQTVESVVRNTNIIQTEVKDVSNTAQQTQTELQEATDEIWGTLERYYVIYDGNQILIVNALPKESATKAFIIDRNGIGFSDTGISGTFNYFLTMAGAFDASKITIANLKLSQLSGGTLTIGGASNANGQIQIQNASGTVICTLNASGISGTFALTAGSATISGALSANTISQNGHDLNYQTGTCTVASAWENYVASLNPYLVRQGQVCHLTWECKPTADILLDATESTICTIPSAFRPSRKESFVCQGSGRMVFLLTVNTKGNVTISRLRYDNTAYQTGKPSHWFPISATWII